MKIKCIFSLGCLLLTLVLISCEPEESKHRMPPPENLKQALERVNKYEVKKESDEINQYIARRGWKMTATGTGIRYLIVDSTASAKVGPGDRVKVKYAISLLDGTLCYSSDEDGTKEFKVEGDNVESGIHEAVLLMKEGEKAKFILPSYRAHGIRGDEAKIPPLSSIVIDLEVVQIL